MFIFLNLLAPLALSRVTIPVRLIIEDDANFEEKVLRPKPVIDVTSDSSELIFDLEASILESEAFKVKINFISKPVSYTLHQENLVKLMALKQLEFEVSNEFKGLLLSITNGALVSVDSVPISFYEEFSKTVESGEFDHFLESLMTTGQLPKVRKITRLEIRVKASSLLKDSEPQVHSARYLSVPTPSFLDETFPDVRESPVSGRWLESVNINVNLSKRYIESLKVLLKKVNEYTGQNQSNGIIDRVSSENEWSSKCTLVLR